MSDITGVTSVSIEEHTVDPDIIEITTGMPGPSGPPGPPGPTGPAGAGSPPGGTTGQLLAKQTSTNYAVQWVDPPVVSVLATDHSDGNSDATAYLNGLIAAASAGTSFTEIVLEGVYRCDGALIAQSNVTLRFQPGTRLIKNFNDNTGAPGSSFIRNASFTTKVNKFAIVGAGIIGSTTPATHKGNIICFYGDDWVLTDFTVDGWSGGRVISFVGDRIRINRVNMIHCTNQPGDGGIRILGGNDCIITECHCESGDDAYQFVPGGGGAATNPNFFSQSIRRCSYIGCTGSSSQGRFMIAALQNRDKTATMTASIIDCSFIGMHGTGGMHLSFFVQNFNSTGDIDGLDFTDCTVFAGGTQSASVEGQISRHPDQLATVGRIRKISLKNFRIRNPRKTSLVTRGGIENLTLQDCHFEKPNSSPVTNVVTTNGSVTITAPAPVDPGNGDPLPPPPFSDVDLTALITGPGIAVNTSVSAVSDDGLTVTMNKAATATSGVGGVTLTIGGTNTIDLGSSLHTRMIGGSVQGGGSSHVIQVGAPDRTYTNGASSNAGTFDLSMRDVLVYDIPDLSTVTYGLNLNRVIGAKIDHCTFVSAAAGTTNAGIRVSSLSSKIKLSDNDLTAVTGTTKILDAATDTKRTDNLGADTAAAGAPPTDVQVFALPGTFTWTKPLGAVRVDALVISAGAGGGSGRRGLTSTIRCGGGGGGGGQRMSASFAAVDLAATEAVVVGAGGVGGVGATTDTTDGNAGGNGGQSLFGSGSTTRALIVAGAIAGAGGTATTGTGGQALAPGCAVGQSASATGATAVSLATGKSAVGGAAGGGAGGGITSANVDGAGGAGLISVSGSAAVGAAGGTAGGGAGGPVPPIRINARVPGPSGAGGGGSSVSAGGTGSAGGIYGGGGGGGGASLNGFVSGAGGAGADGLVVVTSYFDGGSGGGSGGSGGTAGLDVEGVQDAVASMFVDGTNITHSYNDTAGTLTVSAAGGGTAGATGPAGATGAVGPTGPIGPTGPAGTAGTAGAAGAVGPTGATGPAGADGTGVYSPAYIYVIASDQPASVKTAATAGGGYVCDGTADQVEINLALNRAAALVSRDPASPAAAEQRGRVMLSGGRFNISAPIQMRTGTALEGAGFLTELRAVGNTGAGIITLATVNAHLTEVSHLYIYGNSTPGGTCDGINYDMSSSGSTGAYPDVNPDAYHFIHHIYLDQFTGTAGGARNAVKLWAAGTANNRGNIINNLQIRDCTGNGIELSAASDSFVGECHVGGCAGAGYRIATGNTKIASCKSFYSDTYGLWVTSGRGIVSGFESQDDAVGVFLDASPFTCSGVVIDTSRDSGMIVSSPSVVLAGLSVFLRGGGRYPTMTNGLLIDAAHQHLSITGGVTPSGITNPVSAPAGVGSDSFVRVSTGTAMFASGA